MRSIATVLALLSTTVSCAPSPSIQPPARCPSTEAPKSAHASTPPIALPSKEKPALGIDIRPNVNDASIEVTFAVNSIVAAKTKSFSVRTNDPTAVRIKEMRDGRGPLEMRQGVVADSVTFTPSRPTEGDLRIFYVVQSRIEEGRLPWMLSDPDRLEITGDALLLPDIDENQRLTTSLHVDLSPYGTTESGASVSGVATSFGLGAARDVTTSKRELRGTVILAGRMGTAVFDTLEGHDEAAWFGYTSFDPRPVSADTAAFRTAAAEFFGERSQAPQTLLIVPQPGPAGAFVATRRTQSVLVHVAVADTWSGALRIATAVETLHAWIGEKLWIGPEEPARAAEGAWFADGFARHLARDMLFRFGLVTPLEVASEVNSLEAILAMSPFANESNAALAARSREPGVVQTIVARGALYALQVDAAIRQKTENKRSLSDVLRALYNKAKEKRGPLSTATWSEMMQAELGPQGAEGFANIIEKGGSFDLPSNALGPCFRKETRRVARYDIGFDEVATRSAKPRIIVGLRKDGPAQRAGLREGDLVESMQRTAGNSDVPVTVMVNRGEELVKISYEPKGPVLASRGWVRLKDVPDEKCTK